MDNGDNCFYVVRKGDLLAVYKSLSECQDQLSSAMHPPVSVYKGHSLSKEAEQHLASYGLHNADYVINAAHASEDLFGSLVPCAFQEPAKPSSRHVTSSKKHKIGDISLEKSIEAKSASRSNSSGSIVLQHHSEVQASIPTCLSCILEFDGASKGNPGKAGAGAILRCEDGPGVWRLRQGLGITTNNVAEYRALILGMQFALKKGFKKILVRGDSLLVCMQITGQWQIKNKNMITLCKEAVELKDKFENFHIVHVEREFNSEADSQANFAVNLEVGSVEEDYGGRS